MRSWVGWVCGGAVGSGVVVHGTVGVLVVGGVGTRAVRRRVVGVGGRTVGIGIVGMLGNRTAGEAGVVEGTAREVLIVVGSIVFPREGVVLFSYVGRRQPLLLLPSVAEPNSDNLLLQLERVGKSGELRRRWFGVFAEVMLESSLNGDLDACAFFSLTTLSCHFIYTREGAGSAVGFLQPFLEQRFELAHVFEAKLKCLKATYRCLREHIAI